MKRVGFGFLLAAGLSLAVSPLVSAGPTTGIVRTDGQPLEIGPFASQTTTAGPEITVEFQPMYLTVQPNTWSKTFQWEIPANTGLAPGATLSITESIPLIYPTDPAGTVPLVEFPIADWHETIASGDLSEFFQWDTQNSNTSISARIGQTEISINGKVSLSSDSKTIWFDFDPIQIPRQGGLFSAPLTLDILKFVRWIGPVLDPLPFQHRIDILVGEYPSTASPIGDYNHNGVVDAADYAVYRDTLGQTGAGLAADGNGNNQIDAGDYTVWKAHFGQTSGSGAGVSANAAVPEPATLILMMILAVGQCLRRGRHI